LEMSDPSIHQLELDIQTVQNELKALQAELKRRKTTRLAKIDNSEGVYPPYPHSEIYCIESETFANGKQMDKFMTMNVEYEHGEHVVTDPDDVVGLAQDELNSSCGTNCSGRFTQVGGFDHGMTWNTTPSVLYIAKEVWKKMSVTTKRKLRQLRCLYCDKQVSVVYTNSRVPDD